MLPRRIFTDTKRVFHRRLSVCAGFGAARACNELRGGRMQSAIRWESDWDMALSMARVQEKPVLLDFFNPG